MDDTSPNRTADLARWFFRPSIAAALLGVALASQVAVATAEPLDRKLEAALQVCSDISLPNSMARPEGFDLEQHLRVLQAQLEAAARNLASPAGIATIRELLATRPDDLKVFCAVKLAGLTKRPEATTIFEEYSNSEIPGVSDLARHYLSASK